MIYNPPIGSIYHLYRYHLYIANWVIICILNATYHLLREPENSIDKSGSTTILRFSSFQSRMLRKKPIDVRHKLFVADIRMVMQKAAPWQNLQRPAVSTNTQ